MKTNAGFTTKPAFLFGKINHSFFGNIFLTCIRDSENDNDG